LSVKVDFLEEQEKKIRPWLIGCQKENRGSQKLIYQEFYSYGMSICLRYAENRNEAVEILNDGFMKIFDNIKKFDINLPFRPWLRKILVNTAINFFHQRQRQIKTEELCSGEREADVEVILSGISYNEVISLLQQLSPAYRTVFNLYVIEGYKHDEIANLLGISAGTSKSNLFKAKEHLKKILKDFFEADYATTR
jgi:RNA polymerase sigma factor (sigma-70 family)